MKTFYSSKNRAIRRLLAALLTLLSTLGLTAPGGPGRAWGQCFQSVAYHSVGDSPGSVAVGDFNGDGRPDLASADYYSNGISVLLNNGNGTYAPSGYRAWRAGVVRVGDFNGDGKPDLVTADFQDDHVSVLLNNGNGTFADAIHTTSVDAPGTIEVSDFNGDGRRDLAVCSFFENAVSILMGNGDGTFAAAVDYGVDDAPGTMTVGDFNGDGKPDLATEGINRHNVSVLLNNGDGTFTPAPNFGPGGFLSSVAAGDFNRDGKADLVVTSYNNENKMSIWLSNGDGTFRAGFVTGVPSPFAAVVADFNNDGLLDLAMSQFFQGKISVRHGRGDGTFNADVDFHVGAVYPIELAVGDFNGDTKPDIAVAMQAFDRIAILLNSATATFTATDAALCTGQSLDLSTTVSNFNPAFDPAVSTLSYHASLADAKANTNPLASTMVSPAGTTTYYIRYAKGGGCETVTIEDVKVTVNPPPTVSLAGLAASYCQNASASAPGTPAGGSYATDGGSPAASFDPASLSPGPHSVVYHYTDPATTCSNSASQSVNIETLPTARLVGLAASYCQNASATTPGSPAGGRYVLDGGSPVASFDPASLSPGPHSVVYTTFSAGCQASASASASVMILAPIFTQQPSLPQNLVVCANATVSISFNVNCPGNASFTAELSNSTGGFTSGTQHLGPITPGVPKSLTIPAQTSPTSANYRIRIVGSNPTMYSLPTGMFRINALEFSSAPTVSPGSVCGGSVVKVSFTIQGNCAFLPGHGFSAELSDGSGSFASALPLGAVAPGLNDVVIPYGSPAGGGYRVRIRASTLVSAVSAAFTVQAPTFTSTPTVSSDNRCPGEAVRLSFTVGGCGFGPGNGLTAQLSNAAGSFASPVSLGTVSAGALNNVVIPLGTPAGTGYKIRIVSSNPVLMSAASSNFKVKACGNNREAAPEEGGLRVVVSPNPSPEGRLRIAVSGVEGQALKVELFNGMGQSVQSQAVEKASGADVLDWDVSRQPGGLYLLRVSGAKEVKTLKVLR